jgi:regulator of protease activity HflC (stomatin/prohibitin superfamily)
MGVLITLLVIVAAIGLLLVAMSVHGVQQYEKGVVFRFGRLLPNIREPGLRLIRPIGDRMRKVSVQTEVLGIPPQGAITADNVTVTVDAVVYFRVTDPVKALVNVRDYPGAVSQIAQTSLRSVIGRADLDTLLSDRDHINAELKKVMDAPTEKPWGLRIERVEIKDIALPQTMMRSMSDTPGALQLRLLQTVVDVSAEKNSTLVMPFPVEMLRFFDHRSRDLADGPNRKDGTRSTIPGILPSALPAANSSPSNPANSQPLPAQRDDAPLAGN